MTHYEMNFEANLGFAGSLDLQVTTVEQLLDEMPFSDQIRAWLRAHTEVRDALKIIVRDRFVPVHAISIVTNPSLHGVKQSIGIYSIDMRANNQIKQDYLMHEDDDSFVLFTGIPKRFRASKYVQHIKTLEKRYGTDGVNFLNDHHQSLEEVSPDIRPYIEKALNQIRG